MKNLTGILLISFVTLFAYPTQAQTVGIKGGLNLATMLAKMDQQTYSNDFTMNPGFHVGLTVDVPINEFLSFEPGILLSTKGLKFEPEEMGGTVIAKEILYYLDIPLTLKASHHLSDNLKIFAAAGPYVGIGLSGKYTMTTEAEGNVEKEEIDVIWNETAPDWKTEIINKNHRVSRRHMKYKCFPSFPSSSLGMHTAIK